MLIKVLSLVKIYDMKHFKLTTESKVNLLGVKLFRVELTIDCKWGKKGDKGGYVEKESNISDNAWVYGNAEVSGNARVTKKVFTLNFVYNLTLTDNNIRFGCIQKTIKEWIGFLDSKEVIETKRDTDKFKLIEMSLRLAIEQHNQLNK